jgi:hypothetical protein
MLFLAFFALLLMGCESPRQNASLTPKQARTLAVQLSNDKAFALYGCRPFRDNQPAFYMAGHWLWIERAGVALYDIESKVDLSRDGSTNQVNLQILVNTVPVVFRPIRGIDKVP